MKWAWWSKATGQTWQSIETAPKDGTEILVAGLRHDGSFQQDLACWYIDKWASRTMIHLVPQPTHWMPKPEPPVMENQR